MPPKPAVILAAVALVAAGCGGKHNPVIPTEPQPGTNTLTVTIASNHNSLAANTATPAVLTITAKKSDGTPAADGTSVAVNTNLGNFGVDSAGKPLLLTTAQLTGGTASVQFFAGSDTGTANILAQVGTSVGHVNIAITPAPAAPAADFTFQATGLSVVFADASTGTITSRSWDFGDHTPNGTSTATNPQYQYGGSGTYAVVLTVTGPGGSSSKTRLVTVSTGPAPVASFTADVSGKHVLFTDTSSGSPTSWSWNFGDGSPLDTRQNPDHNYANPGTYQVTLTVTNAFGQSAAASKFVTLEKLPVADFTAATSGLNAIFTDTSTGNPTSWSWSFGDGTATDARQNPDHTYAAAGTYQVTLTVLNSAGMAQTSKFVTVSLGAQPQAAFTYQINGLTVVFTDTSTGSPTSWSWSFGDNMSTTQQNPAHTYAEPGTYSVTLTVTNAAGSSSKTQAVIVGSAPVANFEFGASGLTVNFVDRSTGSPTGWNWSFGDGSASAAQNPIHTYAASGAYTVTLTVTNAAGSNATSKVVTVSAGPPPQAAFTFTASGLKVLFTDQSTNNPTSWAWSFGDNTTSNLQNPSHTYAAAGTYTVTLTAVNAGGQSSVSKFVTVTSSP
jgi:PKD repeat protein